MSRVVIISAIAELERSLIIERVRAGMRRARLEGRHTENEALQAKRIAEADGEIAFARSRGYYPYFITNDILEDWVLKVLKIIDDEKRRG